MRLIKSKKILRQVINNLQKQGKTIGLVPTMGALHSGHISLIKKAKKENNVAIASIFVNPLQFGKNEDFSKYPRTEKEDEKVLKQSLCDILYVPNIKDVYEEGFDSLITIKTYARGILCDAFRIGHFDGVLTLVNKFLNQVQPTKAYFGEKDFQQLSLIKKMVKDFDINTKIIACKTVREKSGLALSSRNKYLSDSEKQNAAQIYASMVKIKGGTSTIEKEKQTLLNAGFNPIQYFEVLDETTFAPCKASHKNARIFFAGYLGKTRLIDNFK